MPSRQPTMSTQLDDISTILGEYMLKGWTLTDLQCSTCHISPLMREPAAQASAAGRTRIQFCAFCDGSPEGHTPPNAPTPTLTQATPETAPPAVDFDSPLDPHPPLSSSGSTRSLSLRDRPPSAPPTRALPSTPFSPDKAQSNPSSIRSSTLSSAFVPRPLPPPESMTKSSEEISEIISQRLLQGYSLLQTNCPNASCRGVPLIGYPRAKDGSRDPRRTCVSCGTGYVNEGAMGGMRTIQPEAGPSGTSGTSGPRDSAEVPPSEDVGSRAASTYMPESPRSKKRREMYETGEAINNTLRPAPAEITQAAQSVQPTSIAEEHDLDLSALTGPSTSTTRPQRSDISSSLDRVTSSLALTLDRLSESLASHTTGRGEAGEARYFVDVKLHTEAMRDVLEVLEKVRRVQ